MKMLLTSGGITNDSIKKALVDLLGTPTEECNALYIPTALHGHPNIGPEMIYKIISPGRDSSLAALGWESVGILELTTLPSLNRDRWEPVVQRADALLVEGGDAAYLAHWMRESGMAELLPALNIVWVGVSAGSMVMAPRIGKEFVNWPEARADDRALGLIEFAIFPHLEYPGWESNTFAASEKWFEAMTVPAYAIDEQTAIKVADGDVEVVSEGTWKYFSK